MFLGNFLGQFRAPIIFGASSKKNPTLFLFIPHSFSLPPKKKIESLGLAWGAEIWERGKGRWISPPKKAGKKEDRRSVFNLGKWRACGTSFLSEGKIFLGAGNKGTEEEDLEMLDPAKQETGNKEIVGRQFF